MGRVTRHLPDILVTLIALGILGLAGRYFLRHRIFQGGWRKLILFGGLLSAAALLLAGLALRFGRVMSATPLPIRSWAGVAALSLAMLLITCLPPALIFRWIPRPRREHSRGRRLFLRAARSAVLATPAAAAGYAVFIQRGDLRVKEVELPVAGMAKELIGFRMVQISDIHLSPFLSVRELERAVAMANEFNPHLALVTGDLITTADDPLDDCLKRLSALRAEAGILGCHGNHEIYANALDYATTEGRKLGIDFLRSESKEIRFNGKPINFAGVDYQRMQSAYLPGVEALVKPGMPNILLSHNPDPFPVAAEKGFDCTLAGHTHGGQITVEILNQNLSVARFYTPYVYGLYRKGNSSIYVTRGIGTVGVPARFGAPPEIACIRLCAT